jgi:hypothetical protein
MTGRMSMSEVIERLTERGRSDHSSVTLSRNSRGEVQPEVKVATSDALPTIEDAERVAVEVFDRIISRYPMANGHVRATDG